LTSGLARLGLKDSVKKKRDVVVKPEGAPSEKSEKDYGPEVMPFLPLDLKTLSSAHIKHQQQLDERSR
jgi:hypothetical protein